MKNNKTKLKIIISILIIVIIAFIGMYFFGKKQKINNNYTEIDTTSTELDVKYNEQELTGEWSEYTAKITLDDSKVIIEGKGVTNNENAITIKSAGTYYITGNLTDGNILIDANENDDVQLVLDNCVIKSSTTAAINGIEANKLTITLPENSVNILEDSTEYTKFTDTESQEPDGTLFTKTDLVINGTGKLTVNANYKDGIVSKDELKIINGNIEINSEDDGIRGKDYVAINKANIKVNSKGDGIKSTNNEDIELGYVAIEGGTITIDAEAEGIQAETVLNISENAQIDITTNGEITSSNSNQDIGFDGGFNGGFGSGFGGGPKGGQKEQKNVTSLNTSDDSQSSKGLKAGTEITIENGNIEINSTDDSIHSNGIIIINDGKIKTSAGDDGIHADTNIAINGANIEILKSYEGIESSYVEINGGIISITASDDGINIAGGNDSSAMGERPGQNNFSMIGDSNQKLVINDGNIIVNANGDGLDSNGAIYMNGGNVVVAGPTNEGNGALDYTTECVVTGGEVIIYGAVGMWQNPSNSSTQYCLTFSANGSSGDEVVLKDSSENEITSFEAVKTYGAVTISNPEIKKGETYTLYVNGIATGSLTADSIIMSNSSSGGNGWGGGMNNGMQPERGKG